MQGYHNWHFNYTCMAA